MAWEDCDLARGPTAASRDTNSENRALGEERSSYSLLQEPWVGAASVAGTWEGASIPGDIL